MQYDVFISYSHKDKQTADAVCAKLEQQGIRCWYAPRDITPGADWAESIINAIETVRVMIIIFTDHSNASKQVMNEISNAVNAGVTIVPFKLTNTAPSKGMQYYFTAVHWLDAVDKPMKSSIEELCTRVEGILSLNRSDEPERTKPQTPAPEAIRKPETSKKPKWILPAVLAAVLLAAIVLVCVLTGILGGNGRGKPGGEPTAAQPPAVTEAAQQTEEPDVQETAEPTEAALQTAEPTPAATAEIAAAPIELPTINPNNSAYHFLPEGTAVVSTASRSWTVPANSLFGLSVSGISRDLLFRWDVEDLPKLNKTGRIETEPYGDANEYHKKFHFTLRDGSTADLDIQTAFSYLCFPGDGTTVTLPWSEIVSVSLDWEKPCMSDWPAYARFHLQDGTTVIVPSHTLTVGAHKKPDENQLSFNLYYQLPSTLKTARGYEADFSEIRAIAFGKGAYAPNPDKWTEEIQPGWITDLPVSILFRDGRVLETTVAMDWVKFFALDEFGTFAAIPDQIRYLDFVTDLSEETEPPAVRDSAQLPE